MTMEEDNLHEAQKGGPAKKLSAFISSAARAKLHPDMKALEAVYRPAQ